MPVRHKSEMYQTCDPDMTSLSISFAKIYDPISDTSMLGSRCPYNIKYITREVNNLAPVCMSQVMVIGLML